MNTKNSPIFITGRFRAGTSFMWQVFEQLPGYCAWYEPLHPQLLSAIEHVKPKQDHVGIKDYWGAYRQHPEFKRHYSVEFATHDLYLDEKDSYRKLESYIKHLITLSGDDRAVLQFNRVDFRLPWLRRKFPDALIIHMDREPLSLYHSQRKHIPADKTNDINYWDAYELLPWCYALYDQFPLLLGNDFKHAFYQFFFIYQMSKMSAQINADLSINLDQDVFQSDHFLSKLSKALPLDDQQLKTIKSMVQIPEKITFEEPWIEELNQIMDTVNKQISDSGLAEYYGHRKISAIKLYHSAFWDRFKKNDEMIKNLWSVVKQISDEVIRIDNENVHYQEEMNQLTGQSEHVIRTVNELHQAIELMTVGELLILLNQMNNHMTVVLGINDQLRLQLQEVKSEETEQTENNSDLIENNSNEQNQKN